MKSGLQNAIAELIQAAKEEGVREFLAAASREVGVKPAKKPRAAALTAKPVEVAKADDAPKPPRATGQKRSEEEMGALLIELTEHVRQHPGESIEAIGKALAKPTKLLALPMKKLIAAGVVRVEGTKRASRYSLAQGTKRTNGAAARVVVPSEGDGASAEA